MACLVMILSLAGSSLASLADFENGLGRDGEAVAGDIPGLFFSNLSASTFVYADIRTGYSVTSDNGHVYGNGDYFVSGWVAAYIPEPRAIGRIDLTIPAPGFSIGYSSSCPVTLEAFNSSDVKIDSVTGDPNIKPTGTGLAYLNLTPKQGLISYLTIRGAIPVESDGYWLIDNAQVVPEPAPLLAILVGLPGMLLRLSMRHRR